MIYHNEILNRQTGELISVNTGDWITISELGDCLDLGPRAIRKVLHRLRWAAPERGSGGAYRLNEYAVRHGYGKRISPTKGYPFDVISPAGQTIVLEKLHSLMDAAEAERKADPVVQQTRGALEVYRGKHPDRLVTLQEEVSWIDFHCPGLTGPQVALVLDTTHQLVRKYRHAANAQRRRAGERRNAVGVLAASMKEAPTDDQRR
jgi:hypothetical protein